MKNLPELKIFAKHGTSEKCLVEVESDRIRNIQKILNDTRGGEWVPVDELRFGEVFMFDDGVVYKGYNPNNRRYFKGFEDLH